ncbi:MAG TPA: chorismate synthase [Brumimicrobium sp.]|nr:chorismate synthase [Brumimicrobium sp.]
MAGNSIGHTFTLTTFGESHGEAIGGIIDGVPSNFELNLEAVQLELDRRRPGQSDIVTQRKESDTVRFLSGIFEGKTTGAPIGFIIENENQKSKDYNHIKNIYRPSHADFTYDKKYGHRDYRGGGRSSARETASRVVAGALAKQFLQHLGIQINAFVSQVGTIKLKGDLTQIALPNHENDVRCPDAAVAKKMIDYIKAIRKEGDTVGGVVFTRITGVPIGLGAPVFDKLHADLGKAMLSINAVKGFEYGSGFSGVEMKGSEHNDEIQIDGTTSTNYSGGIQGGISNGAPIYFRVAFKPVATIMQDQESVNSEMEKVNLEGKGRHDPCVVPRAVPIVEAMAAITLFDHYLRNKMTQI